MPWRQEYTPGEVNDLHTTPPKIICRFLRMSRAEEAISKSMLWFSKPSKLNDPFDMNTSLMDYNMTKDELTQFVYATRHPSMSDERLERFIAKVVADPTEWITEQKANFDRARDKYGVCCFSGIVDNDVMWGNYADSGTGMALGFNIQPFPRTEDGLLVQPMRYQEEIKPLRVNGPEGVEAIQYWLTTKKRTWDYEKEFRATFKNRNGNAEFRKDCLKEVYFGLNVQDQQIKKIIDLLKTKDYHNIKCFKMVLNHNIFKMEPTEIDFIN